MKKINKESGLKAILVLISVLLPFILGACQNKNELAANKSTPSPQNVAVLFSSYAQIWELAGGKVSITVGESVDRGFADKTAVIVDETAGHSTINLELLLSQNPDLVIGTQDYKCQKDAIEICKEQGIDARLYHVESFQEYLNVLKEFTDITGDKVAYKINGTDVAEKIDLILSSTANISNKPKVLFLRAGSTAASTKAKNAKNNFVCQMLADLGAENIADNTATLLDGLSLETILFEDPDVILISPMGNENAAKENIETLFLQNGWKDLSAVKNKKYYFLDKDLYHFKPNNRWDEAYQKLKDLLY